MTSKSNESEEKKAPVEKKENFVNKAAGGFKPKAGRH